MIDWNANQAKTEARKKPTLSDKLFGSHKKENTPAAIPVAYRDLEVMLDKKRTQVRTLMHQLDKCRTELAAKTLEHQGPFRLDLAFGPSSSLYFSLHSRNGSIGRRGTDGSGGAGPFGAGQRAGNAAGQPHADAPDAVAWNAAVARRPLGAAGVGRRLRRLLLWAT